MESKNHTNDERYRIEGEYCQELFDYCNLGIQDNRTDGDRLIANLVAVLIADGHVNKIRYEHFLKKALTKLEV